MHVKIMMIMTRNKLRYPRYNYCFKADILNRLYSVTGEKSDSTIEFAISSVKLDELISKTQSLQELNLSLKKQKDNLPNSKSIAESILEISNSLSTSTWDQKAIELSKRLQILQKELDDMNSVDNEINETLELLQLLQDSKNSSHDSTDLELLKDCEVSIDKIHSKLNDRQLHLLFTNPSDNLNCFITILAGAGGTDSCDWVKMLFHMYKTWCDTSDYLITVLDDAFDSESKGFRHITFKVDGKFAAGYFKSEAGVHRLIRIRFVRPL